MSKRIAFCADGTWDSSANNTNVYKIYKAISSIPGEQLPRYDDGVGSDGTPIEKLLGGTMGEGLYQKMPRRKNLWVTGASGTEMEGQHQVKTMPDSRVG